MSVATELFEELQDEEGILCSIVRTGVGTIVPKVVLGRTDSEAVSTREAVVSTDKQDVLVKAADYGALGEPADGDQITYTEAETGQLITLEARPPSNTEKCFYRWHGGPVFRIHCKVTGRE